MFSGYLYSVRLNLVNKRIKLRQYRVIDAVDSFKRFRAQNINIIILNIIIYIIKYLLIFCALFHVSDTFNG
jgi:hypothetical protein